MAEGKRTSSNKLAFGLLMGLAVCLGVLFVTHDGESDAMEDIKLKMPASVYSVDVLKAGTVFTSTPAGEMTLLRYFNKVERKMRVETSERNRDVTKINALMARNAEINAAARRKMSKMLNKKIDHNAEAAHKALQNQIRRTNERFGKAAALANKRQKAQNRRMSQMSATVKENKAKAHADLKAAVLVQQRALEAQASRFNNKIRQTNNRITANSQQMKANAKKAAAALQKTMKSFNHKLNNFREQARAGRSKLAAQMAAQDKKTRAWAANKLSAVMASTAAQFQSVRKQMLKDRKRADRMVAKASSKMTAALAAQSALESKNFASTMSNIRAAKLEANKKLNNAKMAFKTSLLQLSNTVANQEQKLSKRIQQVSGTVESNKANQARINAKRNAEMKRIVAVGNAREAKRLAANKALRSTIKKNAAKTRATLSQMRASFQSKLSKLSKYAEKSRSIAKHQLASATSGLYREIARQTAAQKKVNAQLQNANARARLDQMDALRRAKDAFRSRMKRLEKKNAKIAQKQAGAYAKLTGVVKANAVKSAAGRKLLRAQQRSQHQAMKKSIADSVSAGEARSRALVLKMKSLNKKTRAVLSMKVSVEVTRLRKSLHRSLAQARMASERERKALKKEMTFAISTAKREAKQNLNKEMGNVNGRMAKAAKLQAALNRAAAADRGAIRRKIAAERRNATRRLTAAVSGLNRARLALKTNINKKIKGLNNRVDKDAKMLQRNLRSVKAKMTATYSSLKAKMIRDSKAAKALIGSANKASEKRFKDQRKFMTRSLKAAKKRVDAQFKKAYGKLAEQDKKASKALASASDQMNAKLAKQAALTDSRFKNTVKNIAAARRAASAEVAAASKAFRSQIFTVTAAVKNVRTRLQTEINVVSGEVRSNKRQQALINSKVQRQLGAIVTTSNKRWSASARARGRIKQLMDKNKKSAAKMVSALARSTRQQLGKLRAQAARFRRDAAKDLSKATKSLSSTMSKNKLANAAANKAMRAAMAAQHKANQAKISAHKKDFAAKITNLVNTVSANAARFKRKQAQITGVINKNRKAAAADRKLIRAQQKAMGIDLNKAVVRAIAIGEAKANAVADRAAKALKSASTTLKNEIATTVERAADQVFQTVNGNRQKIADNYLSLKAYCVAAKYKWTGYRRKSKQALVSIGDLCVTLGRMSQIVPAASTGIGMGSRKIRTPFSAKKLSGKGAVKRINGLVDEYYKTVVQVRNRWPFGIGKYLLSRLETSMQKKGCLEVAKVGRAQSVFINARAVGLSNRLSDFRGLSVNMRSYEGTLAKLTSRLAAKKKKAVLLQKPTMVKGKEWQGN